MEELPLNQALGLYYQNDGAPLHNTREVDQELTRIFDDKWMGVNGPALWYPRSPNTIRFLFFFGDI